jgi:hypothetical protein
MIAPTQISMYCQAKLRETEYAGRPVAGETKKKSKTDSIPPTPFSLSPSKNAYTEEFLANLEF